METYNPKLSKIYFKNRLAVPMNQEIPKSLVTYVRNRKNKKSFQDPLCKSAQTFTG